MRASRYFYDAGANNGKPRSAFRHYRQGKFEHCLVKHGCLASYHPALSLRSYSDGSYSYAGAG